MTPAKSGGAGRRDVSSGFPDPIYGKDSVMVEDKKATKNLEGTFKVVHKDSPEAKRQAAREREELLEY